MPIQPKISKITEGSLHYSMLDVDKKHPITFANYVERIQSNHDFRNQFIQVLSEVPYRAYQWETPPVTSSSINRPFEFVVTNSPGIDIPPHPAPFEAYFTSGLDIAVFQNLGGDATLIAPSPDSKSSGSLHLPNYSHIGVFTQHAPATLQHSLWQTVGQTMQQSIEKMEIKSDSNNQPIWLNTAGGGVAWLHIRLDSRPKYYRHLPYKKWSKNTI